MTNSPKLQLADFCRLFDIPVREVRYVLEQGFVPQGVELNPTTGVRREFGPGHCFSLAVVMKLKSAGLRTPLAAEVADAADRMLRGLTQNLNWDWTFLPAAGWFDSDHQHYLDVGDREFIRLVTDANPSREGVLHEFDWNHLRKRGAVPKTVRPFVILRVDLTQIAAILARETLWPQHPNRR